MIWPKPAVWPALSDSTDAGRIVKFVLSLTGNRMDADRDLREISRNSFVVAEPCTSGRLASPRRFVGHGSGN